MELELAMGVLSEALSTGAACAMICAMRARSPALKMPARP